MKIGSLCCGIGGIDLGFIEQGFGVLWAVDIDRKALITYSHNIHKVNTLDTTTSCCDIKDIDSYIGTLEPVDIITTGFPCQAFSIAGEQKGFNHEQGNVFFEVCKVIKQVQPRAILLENVKNILSHDEGRTISVILSEINKLGYYTVHKIMNTAEYTNIPQNRERWYLVAFKDINDSFNFHFPMPSKEPKLSIKDILDTGRAIQGRKQTYIVDQPDNYYKEDYLHYETLRNGITKQFVCYQWRRSYLRENKSGLCPTLTANMGKGGGNVPIIDDGIGIRPLTLRECLRLQGFPEWYCFPKRVEPNRLTKAMCYKQIGNSVTVPVISKIAECIKNVLKRD